MKQEKQREEGSADQWVVSDGPSSDSRGGAAAAAAAEAGAEAALGEAEDAPVAASSLRFFGCMDSRDLGDAALPVCRGGEGEMGRRVIAVWCQTWGVITGW